MPWDELGHRPDQSAFCRSSSRPNRNPAEVGITNFLLVFVISAIHSCLAPIGPLGSFVVFYSSSRFWPLGTSHWFTQNHYSSMPSFAKRPSQGSWMFSLFILALIGSLRVPYTLEAAASSETSTRISYVYNALVFVVTAVRPSSRISRVATFSLVQSRLSLGNNKRSKHTIATQSWLLFVV